MTRVDPRPPWCRAVPAAVLTICLVILTVFLAYPGQFGLRVEAPLNQIEPGSGFALKATLPESLPSVRTRWLIPSDEPWILENGQRLPRGNSGKRDIERGGWGRYRVGDSMAHFSTRDGNPALGRQYAVSVPTFSVSDLVLIILVAITLFFAAAWHSAASWASSTYKTCGAVFGALISVGILVALIGSPIATSDQFFLDLGLPALWALSLALLGSASGWPYRIATCLAAMLPVAAAWTYYQISAASDASYLVAGVIPWSDARLHFLQAAQIAADGLTDHAFNARLIFPAFFASLLILCDSNLAYANALMTIGVMAALAWVIRPVAVRVGVIGCAGFVFLVWYYFRSNGCWLVMTESLGLLCGLVGFAGFLSAPRSNPVLPRLLGLFVLALGSAARPGAILVLPVLGLAPAIDMFRSSGGRKFLKPALVRSTLVLTCAATLVISAFSLNKVLTERFLDTGHSAYGNFAFSLNGLLTGRNWEASYAESNGHPKRVMEENFRLIQQDPRTLIRGSWRALAEIVHKRFLYRAGSDTRIAWLCTCLAAFGLLGLWLLPALRQDAIWLTLAAIGILASMPFAPPWDAGVRPYAVTIPIQALYPAMGWAVLVWSSRWLVQHLFTPHCVPATSNLTVPKDRAPFLWLTAWIILILFAVALPAIRPVTVTDAPTPSSPRVFTFHPGSSTVIGSSVSPFRAELLPWPAFNDRLSVLAANRGLDADAFRFRDRPLILGIDWSTLQIVAVPWPVSENPELTNRQSVFTNPALLPAPK